MLHYPASRRFFIVLLGLWIALAPALSIAPATAMTVQPGMSGTVFANGDDCCPQDDFQRSLCKLMCQNAGQAAIMSEPAEASARAQVRHTVPRPLPVPGTIPGPEPAPPKPASLL